MSISETLWPHLKYWTRASPIPDLWNRPSEAVSWNEVISARNPMLGQHRLHGDELGLVFRFKQVFHGVDLAN